MHRSPAWFDRQLTYARACIAEADKRHTAEELAAAAAALAEAPQARQASMFSAPPHAGLITGGQAQPAGLAGVGSRRKESR